MDCFGYNYWFYGNWPLLTIIFIIILFSVLAYVLIRLFHKYRNTYNYYPTSQDKCPGCHIPVEAIYIRCPECHYKLKTNCTSCGKVVKTGWNICPYCESELLINIMK